MRNFLLTIMLLGAAGVFLLFWLAQPDAFMNKTNYDSNAVDSRFDSYMLNSTMLEFDKNGSLTSKLDALDTKHFKKTNRLEFDKPTLTYYTAIDSIRPWHLKADKGESTGDRESVLFRENVYAWKHLSDGGKNTLKTDKLILYPSKHTVETDHKVWMNGPNGESVGVGMQGNLEKGVFELLSKVRGIYHGR